MHYKKYSALYNGNVDPSSNLLLVFLAFRVHLKIGTRPEVHRTFQVQRTGVGCSATQDAKTVKDDRQGSDGRCLGAQNTWTQ
jgi:hypothetical protein